MAHKNKQPEPDKTERIQKHKRREEGKRHKPVPKQGAKGHAVLKPNERDHNYNYLKHLEDYEEDWEDRAD